jgi:hypothetical protein
VLKTWVISSRAERLRENVTRQMDRVALRYFPFWNALAWHRKLIARKYDGDNQGGRAPAAEQSIPARE